MTTTELPELDQVPADMGRLEWKALPSGETSSPLTGVIGHDDTEGTVTAIICVTGISDKVDDVIVPGSPTLAIKRLKPKGVLDHNWGQTVSRLAYSEELMPGDKRLPARTPNGDPWPAAAGGLLIKAQYNLDKQLGRDAYADAKFYGPDLNFSIGYKVRPGGARRRGGKRYLHDFDIYEWSHVLHGAHELATLTGVKSLTDGLDWYPDGRSGSEPVEGTIEVKALRGRRVVRDAHFWGLPIGTPIKSGMKPRGQTRDATPDEVARTTTPEPATEPITVRDATEPAPGYALPKTPPGQQEATPDVASQRGAMPEAAAPQPSSPGVLAALAALHERYQDFAKQGNTPGAIAGRRLLAQFAAPGADVHASPGGQFAAVRSEAGWVVIDTANAGAISTDPIPPDVAPAQVDDALAEIENLDIPWSDLAARRKRWAKPKTRKADQQAVRDILAKLTPFDTAGNDAQQARYDAEGAITDGNRDDLADALTRMGLPPDQDPHDTASTLLVLPTEETTKRLDAIQAAASDDQPPQAPGMADQVPQAPESAPGAPSGTPDVAEATPDEHGIIEGPDGELDLTEEAAARQDRVEALIEAGDAGLKDKTDAQLGDDRKDLVAELALQEELQRRDAEAKKTKAAARPAARDTTSAGDASEPSDGEPSVETLAAPKVRPGVAGAAEDLGDALNATPRDDAAVKTAADRFAKLLARHGDSPAFEPIRTAIGDGDIHAAIDSGALKAGMLFTAAAGLREQRRTTRNDQARARRKAKRIERDRIRSMIGSIDTELRSRGVDPETYGGHVEGATVAPGAGGEHPEAAAPSKVRAPSESSASTPAPTTPSRRSQADRDAENGAIADELAAKQAARKKARDWGNQQTIASGYTETRQQAAQGHMRRAREVADSGDFELAHAHLDQAQSLNPERRKLWDKARSVVTEQQQDHAQSGDADESTGDAGPAVVPAALATGVRGDHRQADVLREPGGAGGPGDRTGGGRAGGPGPAGGDVRGESRQVGGRETGGDRTGDEADAAGAAAPELAGQRLPAAGDTGPEHDAGDAGRAGSGTGGGDAGVRRREQRTGPAETPTDGQRSDAAAAPEPGVDQPVTTREREAATGATEVPENTPELPAEQPTADRGQLDAIPDTGENFHPVSADEFAPAGKKAKLEANLAALRVLRQLQDERRPATPDEQAALARWAGWGGLPEVFDDHKPEYAKEREELRGLLSDKEWNEAKRNTLNAHYTDPRVVQALWAAVQDLGFDGGRVLEPGSGSGTFIGFAPRDADMVGVELDSTTAAISRALYPQATIRNESFADTRIPAGSFDATVGNVPFGDFALVDRVHNPGRAESIHNHFILKSLALTKPGGIVTLLTSRYTLDSQGEGARRKMAEMGDLLGAVRLPTGSHSKTSGTDVIEDVLIFRRREPGAEPLTSQDWIHSSDRDINGHTIRMSDYFNAHPEQVLGEVTAEKGQFGTGSLIVKGDKDMADLPAALERITEAAKTGGATASARLEAPAALVDAHATAHDGYIGVDADGNFTQVAGGVHVPFEVPDTQREELRSLIGMRDTLRSLLDAESRSVANSPEIRALRKTLNDQYDGYVSRYGPINRYKLTANGARSTPGQGGFRRDPMSAIVRALEVYDPETGTAAKTSIFTKRSVAPREIPTTADTPADALALSLDTYGEVNLPEIARMLGTDEADARARLGDLVYEQPPLTEAEQNAAWEAETATSSLADSSTPAVDLSSVGESVRQEGKLEPAAAYLSGNVRRKLAAARAAAEHDQRFAANVDALEKVIPRDLGVDEVDGRLGAAWIGADDIKQFLVDLIHDGDDTYGSIKVATSGGGIWTVDGADWGQRATEQWGTDRVSAGQIVQALLEQRSIRVTDTIDGKSYPNLEATTAAQAKAEEVSERFSEWLWEDSDRTRRLLAAYNNQFNAIRLRSYDDMPRVFPGMAENFTPRDHQVAAVNRMVAEPCALLAHVVGAGKTAEMAMGTAELKRLGLARKPAIVVPNHMLEQFSREYLQIYPNAKILAAGTDDLKGDKRREFVARAATGDWDCVILTQNAMQLIPMSREQMTAYIDRELAAMRAQLEEAKERALTGGDKATQNTVKKMEKAVLKAEEALKGKLDKVKDAGVTFEQTGIDYVCVDEAHMFSNLRTPSNIQGAGATGSDMASDLHMKLEYLRANNASGRVATFATGTPIRNTVTQAYIMQRFLGPEHLREAGIHSFDQWAATFGQTVDEMELKPEGTGFRQTTRFAKFRNVPELLRLFHLFADVKTADDLNLPTPKLATGGVQNVVVPPSDELKAFIAELGDRADDVRNNHPQMRPAAGGGDDVEDNMLLISTDGRKAALSMQLVGGDHTPGKIEAAADNIAKIWRANKDRPVPCDINDPAGGDCPPPGGMQIVFCDMGTPGGKSEWNAYDSLRDQLAARGLDPTSVRFMHEAKNDREKAELFAAARNGQVAVLVGSTEKMGVGTNVQRRAVALHHLDAPWRPSDVEQRDGRIMRQGNTNTEVSIFRYVTEGSFDAYMWQTLERKKKFIDQIMRGTLGDQREIEDVGDTALSYAEVKALATGNPLLMEKAKVDTQVAKLARLERTHQRTQTNLKRDLVTYAQLAEAADRDAATFAEAADKRTDTSGDKFAMTVAGRRFTDRADAVTALQAAIQSRVADARYSGGYYRHEDKPAYLGTFGGHDLEGTIERYTDKAGNNKIGMKLAWVGVPGTITTLQSGQIDNMGPGILVTLRNNLDGFEARANIQSDRAAHLRSEIEQMQTRVGLPFGQADALAKGREESARLAAAMQKAGVSDASGPVVDAGPSKGLAEARNKAARQVANLGRSTWNKEGKELLKRFINPAAAGKAVASPDGNVAAMGTGRDLKVLRPVDGSIVARPEGLSGVVDDPQALVDELAALPFDWDKGEHAMRSRWDVPYEQPDYSVPYQERERRAQARRDEMRQKEQADLVALRAVWAKHLRAETADEIPSGEDQARARARDAAANANGDTAKMLKRFVSPPKGVKTWSSDDGSIGVVTDTSKDLAFFATDNGMLLNAPGSKGPFDDPAAVANDLAALGIPLGDSQARRDRWYDREQRSADIAAITAVFARHAATEGKSMDETVIPAFELQRARRLGLEVKATATAPTDEAEDESYEDVVARDDRWIMDAAGVMHKMVACPTCGNITMYPVAGQSGPVTCTSCGGKLQMQPTPATVG